MKSSDYVTLALMITALVVLLLLVHFDPANLRGEDR